MTRHGTWGLCLAQRHAFILASPAVPLLQPGFFRVFFMPPFMMVQLRTTDGILIELEERHARKCVFLSNALEITPHSAPIDLLIDSDTLRRVAAFMEVDNHMLKPGYNPLEIYFSNEILLFFDGLSADDMLKLCNAANYLEYFFLLELCCKLISNELAENTRGELAETIKGKERLETDAVDRIQKEFEWFDEAV